MTDSDDFKIDRVKLYFERPIEINQSILINQPTVGSIIDFGEDEFYSMLYKFIGNTTMFRLSLWKNGIDWNQITDYELFWATVVKFTPKDTRLLFGDLDFSKFKALPIQDGDTQKVVLYNAEQMALIDEDIYKKIATALRIMFNFTPKNEFARGRLTKEAIIWEDEENAKKREKEGDTSFLLPIISGCLNHPGFKYKKKELEEVGIYEFMDAAQQIQVYESATALLKGAYSGFVDTSKINKEEFNFMRDKSH